VAAAATLVATCLAVVAFPALLLLIPLFAAAAELFRLPAAVRGFRRLYFLKVIPCLLHH
jgi:hypothetical protein